MSLKPQESLSKTYRRQKPNRKEFEAFRGNLNHLLNEFDESEFEEHIKNDVIKFLNETWYKDEHLINTKDRTDLVIHNDKSSKSSVGVLIEVKKPNNKSEMISQKNLNAKALQELLLYYLRERHTNQNKEIKHLIVTNVYEWFIFDANEFYNRFYKNKKLLNTYEDWMKGNLEGTDTIYFYKEIASLYISQVHDELEHTYFDFRDYVKDLKKESDTKKLIALYKVLSPIHLLKKSFANDSNSLNKQFYHELLHIIGLEEVKEKGKKLIQRKSKEGRIEGSLLENAILTMDEKDRLRMLNRPSHFGSNTEAQLYTVALDLCITWINRILFLKLLESQLVSYHKGDKTYRFLDVSTIPDYDSLESLFFGVLARKLEDRADRYKEKYAKIPYLNSSLFEQTGLEEVLTITMLNNNFEHKLYSRTVLKNTKGKPLTGKIDTLTYLFQFLDAYDFTSEGTEAIQEENKSLINASVLGLIFEKINGYKDGSFYTPGFITMYMCRETIRRTVIQKFNEQKGWELEHFDQLYDKIEDKKEANEIINSIKICDPAVGSGHFLVSALNEIIAIKSELKILLDREGKTLRDYEITIDNDELIIESEGELFSYSIDNKEKQRIQETLFHEKQAVIENCLFGVDINANSVKICRLRLWIELLKNAYYKSKGELETLPNIDINIKTGNSLISRFDLDSDLSVALKSIKYGISEYRAFVNDYKNAKDKEEKRGFKTLIDQIKSDFKAEIDTPLKKDLRRARGQVEKWLTEINTKKQWNEKVPKKFRDKAEKAEKKLNSLLDKRNEIHSNKIYEDAFEWRFEFPEVLDDKGNFIGFDVVIGNPPYFALSKSKDQQKYFEENEFKTYSKGADIYCIFYERGIEMLTENGALTYITSNSWLRSIYGDNLKRYLIQNASPQRLLNIEDIQVFEEATVESSIITLKKSNSSNAFPVVNLGSDYSLGDSLDDYFSNHHFTFEIPETPEWFIGQQEVGLLKKKIETDSKGLGSFDVVINFGIKTGYNEAFIIDEKKKDELLKANYSSKELIHPILRGRDLKRFSFIDPKLYVIGTFPSLKLSIDSYPAVLQHFLDIGKKRLEQSGAKGSRKKSTNEWFETQDSIGFWKDFIKPKIIWGEISDKPKFAYDDKGYYNEATTFLMTGEKLKFLLGILNSKVSEWYFNLIGTTTGMGTNRWKKYKIELLPIKIPTIEQEKNIEELVNEIIKIKEVNPFSDTSNLEMEIDQLVYELYGLTEEEIKIVEGGVG